MKVCIAGGGNIGHSFVGELSLNRSIDEVILHTRQPNNWDEQIKVYYDEIFHHTAKPNCITDDLEILKDIDVLIITMPSNARQEYLLRIKSYINKKTFLIAVPSTGGTNFILEEYFPNNKYAALQRTPYISRIMEYGHSVNMDIKKNVDVYFSKNCTENEYDILKNILNINITRLNSFWPLILSNSNPILHMSSMCSLFQGEYPYKEIQYLYGPLWTDDTSKLALNMDSELGEIMAQLDVKEYKSLLKHYEVCNCTELTNKLKSIPSFQTLLYPLIRINDEYIMDAQSRFILEDLPYGTCFIKLIATLLNIKTPYIDAVIKRIQALMNIEFVDTYGNFNVELWQEYVGFDYYGKIKKLI